MDELDRRLGTGRYKAGEGMKKARIPIEAWFRCRIRSRTGARHPWLYFQAEATNQRELWRQGRYWAGLWLKRQIFDFDQAYPTLPANLKLSHEFMGKHFYIENGLASVPGEISEASRT